MRSENNFLPKIITGEQVHVYCLAVTLQNPSALDRSTRFLSPEELTTTGKFHFQKDRNRFIASHSLLRVLIGSYLDCDPALLEFSHNSYGKPLLMMKRVFDPIYFNMSGSGDRAAYAFTRLGEIGIDIEKMCQDFATEEVAEKFFSDHEVSVFRSLPESDKIEAFYNCWTRKEAFIKAVGEGLSYPLKDFDVSLRPGEPAKLLRIRGDAEEASRWTLHEIPVAAGYKAAFAIRAKYLEVKIYNEEVVNSILLSNNLTKSG